jgi:hypothetical protein
MSGKYEAIDPIIESWVKKHGLHLVTSDRDWPVRSVDVGGGTKGSRNYQIWIDTPDSAGVTVVHVENRNPPFNREDLVARAGVLAEVLEQALGIALGSSHITSRG